jgi:4-hydroxy-tetrahydrodipicolinate reductase
VFCSPTERLTLGHSVTTRSVFAQGAIRSARWVAGRKAGFYDMRDVLFGGDSD